MLKRLGFISVTCLALLGCHYMNEEPQSMSELAFQQPMIKMPNSIIVCRAKQCAPAKLSISKEYIYNTLLHMMDSNARKKALVCAADSNTHTCTEEYISMPITVGITPAYLYIDDVKITDVSISRKNTSALDLILNWNVSYNGQTPSCRPSKTLLYAKNINNVIMEDNGYTCKMTTIGTSSIKTLFAIDYIDLDYGYIGGFYSIGVSGPAFGGGSGYMILRLPVDMETASKDYLVKKRESRKRKQQEALNAGSKTAAATGASLEPAPNVDTIIKYSHPAQDYDKAKANLAQKKKQEAEAMAYEGVKVFPAPVKEKQEEQVPEDKNSLANYQNIGRKVSE